jgi:hypothetical protein
VTTGPSPSYAQPALIGGVIMGVLSALPLIYFGNVCCCLWVISGGVVAAYIFQENHAGPMTPGDGALVGLLAGLLGAVVHLALSIPIDIVMAPYERAIASRILDMAGSVPTDWRDTIERVSQQRAGIGIILVRRVVVFVFMLFIGAVFSTIGGVIGALIFKKDTPPGVIDLPPTS